MRRAISIVLILLLPALFLTSCVSKTEYEKVASDLSATQSQAQSLQTQLTASQNQSQSLQTQLTAAQSQVQSLQTQLAAAQSQSKSLQSDLQSTREKMTKAKAISDMLNALFQPALKGQTLTVTQQVALFVQWTNLVKTVGDAQLSAKFDALVSSTQSGSQAVNQATADFILYLLDLESRMLQ